MDESNRAPQRSRPRPYDLRRKVLLKNFLREQMTHIPLPPPRLPTEDDDAIADDEVTSTVGNEENIELAANNNVQETPVPAIDLEAPVPSTSHVTSSEDSPDSTERLIQPEVEADQPSQPTFTRLSNMLRHKINTVRNRRKGITKAKLKMRPKSPAQKSVLRVSNNTQQVTPKPKSKSFFTMFKTRRAKKNHSQTVTPSPASKSTTANQSVQTDVSFTQDDYDNMEQSNRSLREENRLLSESLSSFMSDFDLKLSPLKIPYGTDSYITSSGTTQSSSTSTDVDQRLDFSPPPRIRIPRSLKNPYNKDSYITSSGSRQSSSTSNDIAQRLDLTPPPRIRIPRSKSMQDRFERRFPNRRTRSMNHGTISERFHDSSSLNQPPPPQPHGRSFYAGETYSRDRPRPRFLSPYNRKPFLVTRKPHRTPTKVNTPHPPRPIVRRSSMPEWPPSYHPHRPIMRHKSTRSGSYGHAVAHYDSRNVINGNVPVRRRSSSSGDYGRPVPFQNLPTEAFY